jgi:hypothetical protein
MMKFSIFRSRQASHDAGGPSSMKKVALLLPVAVLFLAAAAVGQLQAPGGENTPDIGAAAPDFGVEELRGQSKVLLAFFPAAFTGG